MPLFSIETLNAPISMPDAWEHVASVGDHHPRDKRLLPEECNEFEKIIWLERLRLFAVEHGGNLTILEPYKDYQGYALSRRPDPTWNQWIWLYQQIGARRGNRFMRDVIPIMACRDALLPFLETIPDKKLWDEYTSMLSPEQYEGGQRIRIRWPCGYVRWCVWSADTRALSFSERERPRGPCGPWQRSRRTGLCF